jgi:hypothetical protein
MQVKCPHCKKYLSYEKTRVIEDVRDRGGTAYVGCSTCEKTITVIGGLAGFSLHKFDNFR